MNTWPAARPGVCVLWEPTARGCSGHSTSSSASSHPTPKPINRLGHGWRGGSAVTSWRPHCWPRRTRVARGPSPVVGEGTRVALCPRVSRRARGAVEGGSASPAGRDRMEGHPHVSAPLVPERHVRGGARVGQQTRLSAPALVAPRHAARGTRSIDRRGSPAACRGTTRRRAASPGIQPLPAHALAVASQSRDPGLPLARCCSSRDRPSCRRRPAGASGDRRAEHGHGSVLWHPR
jgi:hypothetical protein